MGLTRDYTYSKSNCFQNLCNKIGRPQLINSQSNNIFFNKKPDVNTKAIIENYLRIFPIYFHRIFMPKFKMTRVNLDVFLTAKFWLPFIEFWMREALVLDVKIIPADNSCSS